MEDMIATQVFKNKVVKVGIYKVNHMAFVPSQADMEKDNFFTQARIEPKLFYPK